MRKLRNTCKCGRPVRVGKSLIYYQRKDGNVSIYEYNKSQCPTCNREAHKRWRAKHRVSKVP